MQRIITVSILILLGTSLYAQNQKEYFKTLAGDSALDIGKEIKPQHFREGKVNFNLNKGYYRIIFSEEVNKDDLKINITTQSGDLINLKIFDKYADFDNPKWRTLTFHISHENELSGNLLGKLYWVYDMHTLKDSPQFAFEDIYGEELTNETLKNHVVVINFWGINCGPCVAEIPQLNRLAARYDTSDEVKFIAISTDSNNDLNTFQEANNFNFQLVGNHDPINWIKKFMIREVIAIPAHVVINKTGKVVFQYYGSHPRIQQMLSEVVANHK